ncbi:MAG: M20/M25/M40 family metallo-hydrolase [Deltaproteobacteria bacterium]|nr:M20/M25/M40 family metallo-hydrolase [Deltaproteobacteria bacterium]MDZ4346505.1 M20/M25/M40 family metallo-hydrolase [Candidatus Binatia bacterium]
MLVALRSRLTRFVLSLVVLGGLSAWAFETPSLLPSAGDALAKHVRFLASDELTGRGVDTPGIKLARDYIAREFASYGLRPGGDNGTYFQSFEVATGVTVKQPTVLVLGGDTLLTLNEQWNPLGSSASGSVAADVVFAGYGITAKDYGYDDYAGIDVKDKIVLVLRYEPPPKNDKSPFRKHPDYSTYAALRAKANNARDHGAAGMILVDLHQSGDGRQELISTRSTLWRGGESLVAAQVKRGVIEAWLETRGISLKASKEKIDREEKPASMALPGAQIALQVTVEEVRQRAENVVGILPGADTALKDQNIVIGAHYDHLGFGHFGTLDSSTEGQIHHGADDNGSGTAALLRIAETMARSTARPARTIVFAAFSGEESGLVGSRHYVNQPPFPLASTVAMLNLDMVGRLRDNRVTVFGARSAQQLSAIVLQEVRSLGLQLTESDGVGRSDHMSFYNKKIPALHFFTGNHSDYHRPSDTWEKLNTDGIAKVVELVSATAQRIALMREPLSFVSLPSRPPGDDGRPGQGYGAYLGSIPDFGDNSEGVRLAGVAEGSPAALAGLREGDLIVRFAGNKVQSLDDLAGFLRGKKPGEEVEIVVLRSGNPVTVMATLRTRG